MLPTIMPTSWLEKVPPPTVEVGLAASFTAVLPITPKRQVPSQGFEPCLPRLQRGVPPATLKRLFLLGNHDGREPLCTIR